jgi:DNA-binding response OmpR family regulator
MYARKPCILVISAGQLYRRVREVLREEGFDVLKAPSYSRGIALAYRYRPELILLDMDITGTISGLDCCTLLRQSLSMPILALSVVADIQKKVRTLDVGADDYLVEPCGIDELLARVRALMRRALPEQKFFHYPTVCSSS